MKHDWKDGGSGEPWPRQSGPLTDASFARCGCEFSLNHIRMDGSDYGSNYWNWSIYASSVMSAWEKAIFIKETNNRWWAKGELVAVETIHKQCRQQGPELSCVKAPLPEDMRCTPNRGEPSSVEEQYGTDQYLTGVIRRLRRSGICNTWRQTPMQRG